MTCKRCGSTRNLDQHHVKLKGMGGSKALDDESNLVTLCRKDHEWVHRNPRKAREEGLIKGRFDK